jgi:hypothetical protein
MINIHTILYYILQILVMDRSWMYDRYYPGNRGQIKEIFKLGVELFIKAVKQGPCAVCECGRFRSEDEIKYHPHTKGFKPNYWIWSSHGESFQPAPSNAANIGDVNQGATSSNAPIVVAQNYQHYPFNEMNDMISDALGFNVVNNGSEDEYDGDELPNVQYRFNEFKFYKIHRWIGRLYHLDHLC